MDAHDPHFTLERCRSGDPRALAQAISILESTSDPRLIDTLAPLAFPRQVIGITGSPGAGKSTLISALAESSFSSSTPSKLAILAVDPSSPFTGGALLGDRVRMATLRNNPAVFIRSLGSRDASGGLAAAIGGALRLLALAGFDTVMLETVGAGQSEIEVAHFADTVCVLHAPGLGDDVQWMKAGLLETADVLVVTKADRPEAADLKLQLEQAVAENKNSSGRILKLLRHAGFNPPQAEGWSPPVVLVSAQKKEGLGDLFDSIQSHASYRAGAQLDPLLQAARLAHELFLYARSKLELRISSRLKGSSLPDAVLSGAKTLTAAAEELIRD